MDSQQQVAPTLPPPPLQPTHLQPRSVRPSSSPNSAPPISVTISPPSPSRDDAPSSPSTPTRTYFPPHLPSTILSNLLSDSTFSDVTIMAQTTPFSCHRAILSAASPVFHAMFLSPMLEPRTNTVHLPDTPPHIFRPILSHIYGQPLTLRPNLTLPVSSFIRRYEIGIPHLPHFLDSLLISALSIDNILSIHTHAQMYSALRLQRACDRFLTLRMSSLASSPIFLQSDSATVLSALRAPMRLSQDQTSRRCAQHVLAAAIAWLKVGGRDTHRADILAAVDAETLSLSALVRASREDIAMADPRFQYRLLRAFANRAEGDLGFQPQRALSLLKPP